jgi:phage-related protein
MRAAELLSEKQRKPVRWIGSSRQDLRKFPDDVKRRIGFALLEAQTGRKAAYAKPMKGFGDAGVLEVVDSFDGDAFRAIYTVRFAEVVYVLHAFQKKSKSGIATPQAEIERVKQRLQRAVEDYKQWHAKEKPKSK